MFRAAFFVFIIGWIAWFMLDKTALVLPPPADSVLQNFQFAFDMMRSGYPAAGFLFVWRAHYLLLSLLGGVLVTMLFAAVQELQGRRRMRRLLFPSRPGHGVSDVRSEVTDQAPATTPGRLDGK